MQENELTNLVYKASCPHFEWLECKGLYSGNGHHLAQKVCKQVWDRYVIERPHLLETRELKEITEDLYNLNANISLLYATKLKKPTNEDMTEINKQLGEIIKRLKELQKS